MFLRKCNWKYLLQNIGYIVPTSMCWVSPWTLPPGIHLLDAFLPNIKSLDSKPMDEFLMTKNNSILIVTTENPTNTGVETN